MRGRAADIKDISERVISILNGSQVSPEAMPEPVIIVAEDLAPSETVQFEKDKLLALVTQKGSSNSHTAILARTMNILQGFELFSQYVHVVGQMIAHTISHI